MSAGGLNYSGLVNHGKVTLPSVETWGTNMNILKDPSKSIHTRKIDKVGETSSITQMIDESGSRSCEAIQVYARGVNPCVSVSYSNHGSNGGQRGGGITDGINQNQSAKLPYTIMRDGAFRPPVLLQEDLLPMSRMPRNWTTAYSKPGFADFSKKMRTCGSSAETKEVKNETLQGYVRPTAVYKIDAPLNEPFEVKYVIQPTIKTTANSGVRTMDITQQQVGNPTKEIDNNPLHAHAQANFTDSRHVDNNDFDPTRYLQDVNTKNVVSNVSSNKHTTNIEDIFDLADMPVHSDILIASADAPISAPEQTKYFHDDISLARTLPEHNMNTNIGNTSVYKNVNHENKIELDRNIPMNSFVANPVARGSSDHTSREARLNPKINPGGFSVPGQVPMTERMEHGLSIDNSEKVRMNRMITDSMQSRFSQPAPFGRSSNLMEAH